MNVKCKKEIISIVILVFVNFMLLIFLWEMNAFSYDTNDDFIIASIVSGMHGIYSPYTIYNNIFYGYLLSLLFRIAPVVNWVTFLYIAASFLAYVLLGIVLIKRNGPLIGSIFSYVFLLCTYSTIYEQINYTKISALVGITGFLVILHFVETEKTIQYFSLIIIGICMVIWASWLRFSAFLLVIPFAVGIVIHRMILVENHRLVIKPAELKRCIIPGLVLITTILGTYGYNQYVYRMNPEWKEYVEYNELRTELLDYGIPSYEDYYKAYAQIGLTETDIRMLKGWHYADSDIFTKETLEAIVNLKPEREINKDLFTNFAGDLSTYYLRNPFIICAFLFLMIYPIYAQKKYGFLVWWNAIMMLGELFYFHYIGRPIDRVTMIPLMCFFAVIIFGLKINTLYINCNRKVPSLSSILIILGIALVLSNIFILEYNEVTTVNRDMTLDFLQKISSENALYIWDISDDRVRSAYDLFDEHMVDTFINSTYDSGWLVPSPILLNKQLQYTPEKNIYRALCYESNVYLIGTLDLDLKLAFLRQHYDNDIACSLYRNIYGYDIFAFSTNYHTNAMHNINWDITVYSDRNDFISVEGSVEDFDYNEHYFLEITDDELDKCYTYEISVENGQYRSAIYLPDWTDSDELSVSLIVRRDNQLYRSNVKRNIMLKE